MISNYTGIKKESGFLFALSILWNNLYRKNVLFPEAFVKLFVKNHQNLCLNNFYTFYLENCPCFLSFHIYWQKLFIVFYDFKLIEFLVLFIHAFFFHLDHHTQTTVLYFLSKDPDSGFMESPFFVFCVCYFLFLYVTSFLLSSYFKRFLN